MQNACRLPLAEVPNDVPVPGDLILMMGALADQESPVTFTNIKAWTGKDPLLSHVRHMILHGSVARGLILFKPFTRRKDELSVQDDCILLGTLYCNTTSWGGGSDSGVT